MDSNQQSLSNPFLYATMDPASIEHFLRRFQLAISILRNAQVNYNQFLNFNRNGLPQTQQTSRSSYMVPLGKRRSREENGCENLEFQNGQRMANIPEIDDNPINLVTNSNTRREMQSNQGNTMMTSTPIKSRQSGYALNSHGINLSNHLQTQPKQQGYRGNYMIPLGKRRAREENACESLVYENWQRMVKIPKIDDNPINLVTNPNTRREMQSNQGNMMMTSTPIKSRQSRHAFNSHGNSPINKVLDMEYQEFVAANRRPSLPVRNNCNYREFPKQFDNEMILGPYGATAVDLAAYRRINFNAPKIATRQLLVLVFPRYILATHSLTGKPSPIRYENGNAIKRQLNTDKVEDIIQCVLAKTNCKRQDIKAAITAKCSETARLYKNRLKRNTF